MPRAAEALALRPILVAALLTTGCVDIVGSDLGRYVEREEKRFTVSGRPAVSLSTFDGSIEVRPWDRPEVDVIVEKHAGSRESAASIQIDAHQNGNDVSVDVRVPKASGFGFHMNRSAKLIVSVPAGSDVGAKSGDGSIDIERVAGKLDLHSGDGSIRARAIDGDVIVSTGDGSVAMDGKFSGLRVHTGDGSVRVQAAPGSRAATDWDISTGDGSVVLEIPSSFSAEVDAHTGDGRIHLEDVALSNVTGEIGRTTVKGRLGGGGAALRVRSGDGSITLRSDRP